MNRQNIDLHEATRIVNNERTQQMHTQSSFPQEIKQKVTYISIAFVI